MAKKPKNPATTNANTNGVPTSGNIFETLFGSVGEHHTPPSLFSDTNPFRRKPTVPSQPPNQQNQQVGSVLGSAGNPSNGVDENPSFVEVKEKKGKNKEKKKPGLDVGLIGESYETHLEINKLNVGFGSDEGFGKDRNGEDGNPSFVELKKKKRKSKEKKEPGLDSGSLDETPENHLETKKSKTSEVKSRNFGVESEEGGGGKDLGMEVEAVQEQGEGKNQNVGVGLEVKGMDKKKKKKRKRDEVEAEYEARRYRVNDGGGEGELGGKVVGEKRKKADDTMDAVVSKEGFDDEAKLIRTVFVGNLPLKVKKKALFREFSQFGEVDSVRIRSVPLLDTKTPRKGAIIQKKINDAVDSVHAYIIFKTEQAAEASLAHNMCVVGGNHIRVDRACPPRKKIKGENAPLYDNKRTVFVGNLPFDVKDEEIYQFFSGIKELESSIEAIRVVRDPGTSMGKGIAYILFKTRGAANLVVKKRSLKLRDRELRLSHARSDVTPSKRKNQSPGGANNFPTKKLAGDSRTPYSHNNVNTKASTSYQGLRGTKSGVQKKVPTKKIVEAVKFKSRTHKREKREEGKGKRPSVAARKAKALKVGGGSSKQTGKKRKMESRTPQSARFNKKTKISK
ncbi:nucleolar protein 12-like [Rhododendron vialii]|uniref:nucleolar protein 12-like n=1 Tax=Rhododendron vialii TaxID=182163 RepID=UPI00265F9B5C|nr:nucleolar protein 12-like [Rhododendron vialii]